MQKSIFVCITVIFFISLSACGSKGKEIKGENIIPSPSTPNPINSKDEVQDVEAQIQKLDDKIVDVKIMFASSNIESSSLDIVIVSLTTKDDYKVSNNEKKTIKSIINKSAINKIINYKEIEIQYD